jgi:hypothetical protein
MTQRRFHGQDKPDQIDVVPAYLKVRGALKQCKGSLSEDVLAVREDRI